MTLSTPTVAPATEPTGPDRVAPAWRGRVAGWAPEAAVLVLAGVLTMWSLSLNGMSNTYYAATVRSMTESWTNFAFGSFDPGGWITTDKPPFPYWIGAAVVKVFGFSSWTLLLPSAAAAVATVALLMGIVRPLWGRWAAVVAGVALAVTPAAVAVGRSNNPDAMLALLVTAAAWATVRALRDGRTRWIVAAGVLVGLAFLTKLLAGFMVLPALWLAYLVAGPGTWTRRILQLLGGTAAVVIVAGVWVAAVDLIPPDSRPYIGSSRDGSALDLVLGYNGLGRVLGQNFDSNGTGFPGPGGGGGPGGGFPGGFAMGGDGIDQFGGAPGAGRLFNDGMGDQIMWLFPLALAAGAVGAGDAVRRGERVRWGTILALGAWLGVTALVYSTAKGIFHNYYVSYLAPPLAGLVGIGVARVLGWSAATSATEEAVPSATAPAEPATVASGDLPSASAVPGSGDNRAAVVILAIGLVLTAGLQLVLLRRVAAWEWLRIAVPVGLVVATVLLLASALVWRRRPAGRLVSAGTLIGVIVALAAPTAWSLSALQQPANGTFPDARPVAASSGPPGFGPPGASAATAAPGAQPNGGPPAGSPGGGGAGFPGFGGPRAEELNWLESQRTTERWLIAYSSSMEASAPIIEGRSVMAMGGFSGSDPAMTQERLADLVDRGELRFLSAGQGMMPVGGTASGPAVAAQVCTTVPASTWGGTGSGVLDCRGKGDAIRKAQAPATPSGGTNGFDQLQGCLADKGITMDQGGPPDFSDPKLADAFRSCMGTSTPPAGPLAGSTPPGATPGAPPQGAPPGGVPPGFPPPGAPPGEAPAGFPPAGAPPTGAPAPTTAATP